MNPKKLFLSLFLTGLLFIGLSNICWSLPQSANSRKEEPLEITSERMRSLNKGEKVIFSGDVIAIWGDLKIKSDILEIYNNKKKEGQSSEGMDISQKLQEIIAIGNVDITRGTRRAKGDKAIYFDKLQKIVLTGKPRAKAWEEDDMIEAQEMIFFLEQDRFVGNGRVRVKSFPKKNENTRKKSFSSAKPR